MPFSEFASLWLNVLAISNNGKQSSACVTFYGNRSITFNISLNLILLWKNWKKRGKETNFVIFKAAARLGYQCNLVNKLAFDLPIRFKRAKCQHFFRWSQMHSLGLISEALYFKKPLAELRLVFPQSTLRRNNDSCVFEEKMQCVYMNDGP